MVNLVVLARPLRATTKKVVNFSGKKSAPQTKSWLRLWPVTMHTTVKSVNIDYTK